MGKESELEARERTKREAGEVRKAERAGATVGKEAELEARERTKREAGEAGEAERVGAESKKEVERGIAEAAGAEVYQGPVKLVLVPPIQPSQMRRLEAGLSEIEGLSLGLISGSVDGGTEVIVSVKNSIPLVDILKGLPSVAEAVKEGKSIKVTLKTD